MAVIFLREIERSWIKAMHIGDTKTTTRALAHIQYYGIY